MTSDPTDSLKRAAERVRLADPDRFAATMATPAALRPLLWPLYAVNLEIGRAAWASAEPMIGEMRLQWWVDSLHALADSGTPPDHEIGAALVAVRGIAGDLAELAEARRRDCWRERFSTADDLFGYLRATSGRVYALAGAVLGCADDAQGRLSDFGTAAGMAGWLRAADDLTARGWDAMPLSGESVRDLAQRSQRILTSADRSLGRMSRPERIAMLPGWQAKAMLSRAIRTGRSDALAGSEFRRRLGLLRASLTI